MKLGLVTDSLVDRSLAEAAAVCRGLGLEQVELGCGNWSPAPHVDLKGLTADAGARHRLLDTLGENGLTISALNCSGNPLFPGEKGAGDRAVAEGTFLLAEQLGVETVVMMSGLPGGCPEDRTPTWIVTSWPPETEEILRYQWKAAVPVWKALAARARDHGVKRIALEFHGWQLVYNVETLRRLRSEVGDDILGVNLDPSHLFWMGADPVEVARALADCIYHVHIKDVRLEPAAGQNTLLDTKGVLEFASRSWNPRHRPRRRLVAPLSGDAAGLRLRRRPQHRTGGLHHPAGGGPAEGRVPAAAGAARLKYAKPRLTNEAGLFSEQDHRRKFQYRVMAAASRSCTARITGTPTRKTRWSVLWRKRYIPSRAPTLPPTTARSNRFFSGTRWRNRGCLARSLSTPKIKKVTVLMSTSQAASSPRGEPMKATIRSLCSVGR